RPLRHGEFVRHLEAGSVAFSTFPIGLPDEADGEAAFPVYKTNNPAQLDQPFLLIVRTQHIVTSLSVGSVGFTGFPAYGRMLHPPLLAGRATKCCYLRTVRVVTQPVGWGWSFLPASACRHAGRTISSAARAEVWRIVSEDSGSLDASWP